VRDWPDVRYAHNGDVAIAYQVFGQGPINLVCVPGFISNLYWNWELPEFRRLLTGLGSFARVAILDRRGVGLSDRLSPNDLPPLEVVMDDIITVMDDAGIERAAVFGWQSGATHAALLAATYPGRVSQLVTFALDPCPLQKPGWTLTVWSRGEWESYLSELRQGWGTREWVQQHAAEWAPGSSSSTFENWAVPMFPLSANPATAEAVERLDMETDIRAVLPAIHRPTLLLYRPEFPDPPPELGAYVAAQISGATLVALPGRDYPPYVGDVGAVVDEIEAFLTGERHRPSLDRILSTVLFTDIVGSTQRLAELGDARWATLLARHDDLARREIERHRGRYIDSAGDGLLASFDGPARAVRCAQALGAGLGELGLGMRAGCHTGEIELAGDRIRGLAVHIGARVGALARAGEVLVSSTVKDLTAGSGLVFEDAGEHELKGVPDRWHLYRVLG
jgi:class 3 adenylate cyclase/pimeloyl-ACP methyl ester carboxylesterase